jgi:ABC-type dipeptide/oligopeptide/nickel transport system permease subunit
MRSALDTHGFADPQGTVAPLPSGATVGGRARTLNALRHNPWFWIGAVMVGAMVMLAVLAPLIAPHDPLHQFRADGFSATPSDRPTRSRSARTGSAATTSAASCLALGFRSALP